MNVLEVPSERNTRTCFVASVEGGAGDGRTSRSLRGGGVGRTRGDGKTPATGGGVVFEPGWEPGGVVVGVVEAAVGPGCEEA